MIRFFIHCADYGTERLFRLVVKMSCIISIGLYTLVPQHNMLEYPGYWYEYLIVLVFGYCVIVSAQMVLQVGYRTFQP